MTYQINANILNSTYTVDASYGAIPQITAGQIYTTTGTNGAWANPNTMTIQPSGIVKITGKDADIDINGRSLKQFMDDVEQRLNLLRPNTELEKEWADLKLLGDQYRALEKEINNKMTTWDILKTED
jgi:hypothetical protein